MTQIFLIRHGETEWSREQRHTSVTELDLTEAGVGQALSLRDRLDPDRFDEVICSPRLRAVRTALLAGFARERLVIDPDLAEWYYGDYEGRTSAEIRQEVPGWRIWDGAPPGGESGAQVQRRSARVIGRARDGGLDRVVLFGHGHALRVLALTWLGLELSRGDQFPLSTATISVLASYRDENALLCWNAGVV